MAIKSKTFCDACNSEFAWGDTVQQVNFGWALKVFHKTLRVVDSPPKAPLDLCGDCWKGLHRLYVVTHGDTPKIADKLEKLIIVGAENEKNRNLV